MSTDTKNKTIIGTVLVDRSGSMHDILPTLLKSLHSFIDETKQTAKQAKQAYFRLSTFSVTRNVIFPIEYNNKKFGDIETLDTKDVNFHTYGCTRLIDSAIEEVDILESKLNELDDDDVMSWFVLLTDGEDNLSQKPSLVLSDKIKALKEKGVCCMFMGANIDAIKTGNNLGFGVDNSLQVDLNLSEDFDSAPLTQGFRAISDNITQNFMDSSHDSSFSTTQRVSSAPSIFANLNNHDDEIQNSLPTLRRVPNGPIADLELSPISHHNPMDYDSDTEISFTNNIEI